MIKNIVIRVVVLVLVFVASFAIISHGMNKSNIDLTTEMAECTLPTITVSYGERAINVMYGYTVPMSGQYMRDAITPLDEKHKLPITVTTYGTTVKGITFEVRSLDTERLIETSEAKDWEAKDGKISAYLNIQDLLEDDTEYLLNIKLVTEEYEEVNYYTRIIKDIDYNTKEKLDFVESFHQGTIEKSEAIVTNLESNSTGDNSSYHYVNIHSSFSQVTFGDFVFEQLTDVQTKIMELNNQTAVITLTYRGQIKNAAGEIETYDLEEFYRVRYTKDRMYLLDFERTMDEVFDEKNKVYYAKAISLGISGEEVEYMSNADGSIVSFVQQGDLYSYNSSSHSIAKVFGFTGGDDIRYWNMNRQIKIIDMDESGSIDFIVAGYMNRGNHEGQTGVAVYRYDSLTHSVQEELFIQSDKPYQMLKEEIGQLAYVSGKGILYISLEDNVYAISMDSKQYKILVDSQENGTFVTSENNVKMAWQESASDFDSQVMNLIDFDTGKVKQITVDSTQRIKPIGFVGQDFVYGIANVADFQTDSYGNPVFPMYRIVILNEKYEVVKEYEMAGLYTTAGTISENMITLTRVAKEGGVYVEAAKDQIVHSTGKESFKVTLESITTDLKKREYQLLFTEELKEKQPKYLYPKMVVYEDMENMILPSDDRTQHYYVYAKGKLDSMYNDAGSACLQANSIAGVVITEDQSCIYERTKRKTKNQMTQISTVGASDTMSSLGASVTAILNYYGVSANLSGVPDSENAVFLLKEHLGEERVVNLSGLTLDYVLYLVSRDCPVLVKLNSGQYGVLVGYNELNTIVMNPVTGTTGYVGMEDSKEMFSQAGNYYVGCLK